MIAYRRNTPIINLFKCLMESLFSGRNFVKLLESKIGKFYENNYVFATSSGRQGMEFILRSLNLL
jgi:dTDP-4-amino-4,6-dideoxygalactose transaminase